MAANDTARIGFVRRALRTLRKGTATTRQELFNGMPNEEGTRLFTKRVMNKLTACGAVRRTEPTAVGQSAVYLVADVEKLDDIMESDETISDFLWSQDPPPPDPVAMAPRVRKKGSDALPPPLPLVGPPVTFKPQPLPMPPGMPAPQPSPSSFRRSVEQQVAPRPAPVMPAPVQPVQSELFMTPGAGGLPAPDSIAETNRLLSELIETMHTALQSVIYTRDQTVELRKEVAAMKAEISELKKAWS